MSQLRFSLTSVVKLTVQGLGLVCLQHNFLLNEIFDSALHHGVLMHRSSRLSTAVHHSTVVSFFL